MFVVLSSLCKVWKALGQMCMVLGSKSKEDTAKKVREWLHLNLYCNGLFIKESMISTCN